jgi:ABC-2 type transport system ATP-binding protein
VAVFSELAVLFDSVSKSFAGSAAVRDLSFRVPRGSVFGLLGPNGAGKTTTIRMLMSILRPDDGRIRVFGEPPSDALKDRIGYLPEERGLYQSMSVIDNLSFFGSIHGLDPNEARRRGRVWLERFRMANVNERKLSELSKGNQQKIQIIATILHEPDLLVLDEPFSGLDPVNQDRMRDTILTLAAAGTTLILSTHQMIEVERLCSHLVLVDAGRALVEGSLAEVKRRHGSDVLHVDVDGDDAALVGHAFVLDHRRSGKTHEIRLRPGCEPSEFLASVAPRVSITRFEVLAPSVHTIFVNLVGAERAEEIHAETEPKVEVPS